MTFDDGKLIKDKEVSLMEIDGLLTAKPRPFWRKKRVIVGNDAMAISFIQRLFPESYARILKNVMPKNII